MALRGAHRWRVSAVVALVLLGVVGLVGCGSRSPAPHSSASPTAATPTAPSPTTPSPSGTQAGNQAAIADITKTWETFFSKDTPASEKLTLLQDSSKMQQAIEIFSSDPRLKEASAKVTKVELTSADQATVTYDILLNGATALPNAQGTAILQDGAWKVSDASFCALAALGHSGAIPGCG